MINTMCELACQIRDLYGYKWISENKRQCSGESSDSPIGPFLLTYGGRRRSKVVWLLSDGPAQFEGFASTSPYEQKYYAALAHEMAHLTLMDGEEMGTEEECVVLEHAWLDALKPMREIRTAYFEYSINGTSIAVNVNDWYSKTFEDLVRPKGMKWWSDAKESLIKRKVLDKDGTPTWRRSKISRPGNHRT